MRATWMILSLVLALSLSASLHVIGHEAEVSVNQLREMAKLTQAARANQVDKVQRDVYTHWLERELQGLQWEMHVRRTEPERPPI